LQVSLTLDVSSAGFKALAKLPHLHQFIFGDYMPARDWKHELRFLVFCTKYLPHLRVAGRSFEVMNVQDCPEFHSFECARGYHNKLVQQLKRSTTLSLQMLNLADDVLPREKIKFSGLEELILGKPSSRSLDWCDRHAKLTALGLYECHYLDVLPALCRIGQRLQKLVLCSVYQEISLVQVLKLCPILKHLKVDCCRVTRAPEKLPDSVICHLEEVVLGVLGGSHLAPGFLRQVNKNYKYLVPSSNCGCVIHCPSDRLIYFNGICQNIKFIILMPYGHLLMGCKVVK
jgi:hypothetical protein